ncbi:MAG TPA: IS5 family transposase [Chloroflexota bacterium]
MYGFNRFGCTASAVLRVRLPPKPLFVSAGFTQRTIKRFADAALLELSPLFDDMYAADGQGRASIPPERLLKASLLISLYSVRSERAFCEELTYHLLFRWFLDLDMLEPSFDHSTFSKNRARLLRHRVSREFFDAVVSQGTGQGGCLSYMGQALMENRHGLLVDFQVTTATGTAERDVVPQLIDDARVRGFHPKTLGADKGYDTRECVQTLRAQGVTPHVAQNTTGRRSAVDGRTTHGPGYIASQKVRRRIEEIFGWMKTVGGFRKTRYRGLERVNFAGYLVGAAYNLVRLARLATLASAA